MCICPKYRDIKDSNIQRKKILKQSEYVFKFSQVQPYELDYRELSHRIVNMFLLGVMDDARFDDYVSF